MPEQSPDVAPGGPGPVGEPPSGGGEPGPGGSTRKPRPRILARYPDFRYFWLARVVSLVGDGAATIALVLLVSHRDGGTGVALLLIAESIPRFFGPVAGALADRLSPRIVLVGAEFGQAVLFVAIAVWVPSLPVLLPMVAVAAFLATMYSAAGRALVPRLIPQEDRVSANAWISTAFNLQGAVGPVLGGGLIQLFGSSAAFGVNAASFLVGGLLLAWLPKLAALSKEPRDGGGESFFGEVRAGLRYVRTNSLVRNVIVLLACGVFFGSMDNLALVFLAGDLSASPTAFGVLTAAFGVAMVGGSALLTTGRGGGAPHLLFLGGWLTTGLGLALTGLSPFLTLAVAMQAFAGFGNAFGNVGEESMLQRAVPGEMLGRVSGVISASVMIGSTASYAVGGALLDATSATVVFLVAGLGLAAVTALFWVPVARSWHSLTKAETVKAGSAGPQ